MADLLGGSSTIRTSVSDDIFNAKTYVAHHHKQASNNYGTKDGSSTGTSTPPCAVKYKVATNTPETSILFNQLEDIKVGCFGRFEFVDSQSAQSETFRNDPMIFPDNPTNQNKTTVEKELQALSDYACLMYLFI